MPRIYLDSCALIEALENNGPTTDLLVGLFAMAGRRPGLLVTSELSFAEVMVLPLKLGATGLLDGYARMFGDTSPLEIASVRREVLHRSAIVRARRRSVRLPDAIHIATAEASGCSHVVTNDGDWTSATALPLVGFDDGLDLLVRSLR